MTDDRITSFISFDVEALFGRAVDQVVERLVWGEYGGGRFGISRLCSILNQHKIKGNFMVDFAMCSLYGERAVRRIVDHLRSEGHELHAHLHSEWVDRRWGINLDKGEPVAMNRTDRVMSEAMMQYTAFQFRAMTGLEPSVFRNGGFLFNAETVDAIRNSGFTAASNFNAERHANTWQLSGPALVNEVFHWPNQLLEIPVDLSPEPLTYAWDKYLGMFHRVATRKAKGKKTFNLVLHSWSLLKREGESIAGFAPEHEERLHKICEHLNANTLPSTYNAFLARPTTIADAYATLPSFSCKAQNLVTPTMQSSCNICGHLFSTRPDSEVCPSCKSHARQRQLAELFARIGNPFDGMVVLSTHANGMEDACFFRNVRSHLSSDVRPPSEAEQSARSAVELPAPAATQEASAGNEIELFERYCRLCHESDAAAYAADNAPALQLDLQDMPSVRSDVCDRFLALHSLNRVVDVERALHEIHRVLRPGGVALITIPLDSQPGQATADALNEARARFGKYFEVSSEVGVDPVLGGSLPIFFLHKARAASASERA